MNLPHLSKRSATLIIILFLTFGCVFAQNFDTRGRISNSIYAFEKDSTTHVRFYQYLRFTGKAKDWNNLSLNVAARVLTDTEENLPSERRFNAFRLSVSGTNYFDNLLDFELGRQFFHPGLVFGSMDGLNLNFKLTKQLRWQIFGGVQSSLLKSFDVYKPADATVYGSTLKYRNLYNTHIQLAYFEQKTKSATQWQLAGLNLTNFSLTNFQFQTQLQYDFVNKQMHRIYAMGKFTPDSQLHFLMSFKMQQPQVYGDSYFQIFNFKHYRQFTLSGWYEFFENYAFSATYNLIQLEEGEGHRIIASVNNRNGSLGLVYETGDLGDQVSILADYGYEIYHNLIASVSLDYTRYKFSELYDFENQMGNAVRLAYRFMDHWRVDLEYQWLNSKFRDSDHRLLNHIHFIW